MPETFPRVQPGDLITADLMNRILAALEGMDGRVTKLEQTDTGGAGTAITALLPSGTKRISDSLHIIGRGFDAPGGNIVTVDGIQIPALFGEDRDHELIVTIPNIQGVTESGKTVIVIVSNTQGTDSEDFMVHPAISTLPEGQIFVNLFQSPSAPQLNAGQSYTFVFNVKAITFNTLGEAYTLSASVSTGWPAQVVDASDNPISPSEIWLPVVGPPDGATQTVRVRVSIPSGAPAGTSALLGLSVTSKRNPTQLKGESGGDTITVGAAAPPPNAIPIAFVEVRRLTPSQPEPSSAEGVVRIAPSAINYRITFSAQIKGGTVYSVQLEPPADTRWTASLTGSSVVAQQNVGPVAADTNLPIFVFLRAQAGAPAATLVLHVTSTTEATQTGHTNQPIGLLA